MSGGEIDAPYRGGFVGRTHRFAIRVYFEDTDAAGIVYYANYLRFMERARSDMLRAIGIDQRAALDAGEGVYAVAEARIKYHRPAKLDDAIVVVSELGALGAATATIHQRVMRDGELLADATIVAAFLSPDGRPKRQPKAWLDLFKPFAEEK
ncbi:MAG TPA: YbgC/FadM family acyl-CoA thioesterase [Allosphingosinicella sp.]|jgi:acyl-CoA thioester hydrolase